MRRFRFVGDPITFLAERFPNDWQEVFEKPLHKDTDLGYYAGLAMANGCDPVVAIFRAKELIKLLDQETK